MEVLLRSLYGATAVTAVPRRPHCGLAQPAEVLNMLKVSAVPPRRSAVLTVFGGATAINDGVTAEPRRSWRCHCGLCRTSTAVAPRLRCDGGSTAEARRNMLKVSAVPPRRSAVLTVFGGATAINDGTTAELRRSWRCHCGLCRTSTAVAPRIRCDGGISALRFTMKLHVPLGQFPKPIITQCLLIRFKDEFDVYPLLTPCQRHAHQVKGWFTQNSPLLG